MRKGQSRRVAQIKTRQALGFDPRHQGSLLHRLMTVGGGVSGPPHLAPNVGPLKAFFLADTNSDGFYLHVLKGRVEKSSFKGGWGDPQGCKVLLRTPVGKFGTFPRRPLELGMSPSDGRRLGVPSLAQKSRRPGAPFSSQGTQQQLQGGPGGWPLPGRTSTPWCPPTP